jgi:hypothetical protein
MSRKQEATSAHNSHYHALNVEALYTLAMHSMSDTCSHCPPAEISKLMAQHIENAIEAQEENSEPKQLTQRKNNSDNGKR